MSKKRTDFGGGDISVKKSQRIRYRDPGRDPGPISLIAPLADPCNEQKCALYMIFDQNGTL